MALSNIADWKEDKAASSCGSACGASAPEEKPAACGASAPEEKPAACGASAPEEKPAACGSACGAGDK